MAADQQRKSVNAGILAGCNPKEQNRAKKIKLGLRQDDLDMRSKISLEWDGRNKSVVAKMEQIGISWRDMVPFVGALSPCFRNLADVFTVPQEIFEVEDLANILSFEVWQSQLSEYQRSILIQFLPKESEPDHVVQKLLAGDNFHFGNPFMKWGSLVCSGKFHPDDVLHREQSIKANKNAYYSELQKYHNNMIENLQMWKERWEACQNLEEEIVQKLWRSGKRTEKSMQFPEFNYCDPEEDEAATLESCSWATYGKACRHDNNPSLAVLHGEPQRRKGFSDSRVDSSSDAPKEIVKLKKGEKSHKRIIQCSDGAKYMSYIKVSKEQHQRVKSTMKHTGNSIQPRSLNNVLGNLDMFHVRPFEIFEEEERQKLHNYWLQLANKDIPAVFANRSEWKLEVWQLTKSLHREIEENLKFQEQLAVLDDEKDYSHDLQPELTDGRAAEVSPAAAEEDEEGDYSNALLQDQMASQVTEEKIGIAVEDEEKRKNDYILLGHVPNAMGNMEENYNSVSLSTEDQHLEKVGPISSGRQVNGMKMDSHDNNTIARGDDLSPIVSEYPGNMNHANIPVSQGDPCGSTDDVWSAVSVPESYYHSASLSHGFVSSSHLSLAHPQVIEEPPAQVIALEVDTQGKACGRELLHGQSDDLSFYSSYTKQAQSELPGKDTGKEILHRQAEDVSFPSSYSTQDRNELLESFFKGQGGLTYDHEQKRMGLDFQQSENLMMETGQFPGRFRDQADLSHSLDMRQKRINDIYLDQNIHESLYSDEGRFSVPRNLPVNNTQDWGVGTTRMFPHLQSHLNGGDLMSQNWFPVENQGRSGWSGLEGAIVPNQSIGSESHSDQSLFSILSECNELRSGVPFDSVGSGGRFMQPGVNSVPARGIPGTSNILQQTANPLCYLSHQQEATVGRKANNIGWMGVSHQNSGLQESISKPFVRSWNQ